MSKRRAVDITCLDFSKVYDTFFYNIFADKMVAYVLDR